MDFLAKFNLILFMSHYLKNYTYICLCIILTLIYCNRKQFQGVDFCFKWGPNHSLTIHTPLEMLEASR